ncbi:MAG: hypothetical protein ABC360_05340 [Acetomicrobium sp.]
MFNSWVFGGGVLLARVLAVSISSARQEAKRGVPEAHFIAGEGIESDSHKGFSDRHVSLLRAEDIKAAEAGISFPPGSLQKIW